MRGIAKVEANMTKVARLMVLALALTVSVGVVGVIGCGGNDDKGGSRMADYCSANCDQIAECDENYFNEEYDSKSDCEDECVDSTENINDSFPECESEMMDYHECWTTLSCDDLAAGNDNACNEEYCTWSQCLHNNGYSDWDNVAACQDAEDTLNALPCVTEDFNLGCSDYEDVNGNYFGYFSCLSSSLVYSCDGDVLTCDEANLQICTDIADELASSC